MRKVFRDYLVLLIAPQANLGEYRERLEPLGFGRIQTTDDDRTALSLIKEIKPNLVVAARSLPVFSGPQLLAMTRKEYDFEEVPFVIIGLKEDCKEGGLACQVEADRQTKIIGLPVTPEEFAQAILDLLDPLIDPNKEQAYELIEEADRASRMGDNTVAAVKYAEAVAKYGRHGGAWLKLADILAELGRGDEAEKAYHKAVQHDQYNLACYQQLAMFYEFRNDFNKSMSVMQQALGVAIVTKSPKEIKAQIMVNIGRLDLSLKKMREAGASFDRAAETNPNDAKLRAEIGDAYVAHGHYAEAEAHYLAALALDPKLAHVFNKIGIVFRKQGLYDRAVDFYRNALRHQAEDEHLLFNMARAYYDAGDPARAEATLIEALNLAPDMAVAHALLKKIRGSRRTIDLDVDSEA